jgi:hypothetical protein
MARSYSFAVLRLSPDPARGEAINLGIVVFRDGDVDVRIGTVTTRARIVCSEATPDRIHEGAEIIRRLDAPTLPLVDRHRSMRRFGLFELGELGYFTAENDAEATYEAHIDRLLRLYTATMRGSSVRRRSASALATSVRKLFRQEKVLAALGDAAAINEHKIVPDWPIPTRPSLQADLALKNRIMRVCEVVELSLADEGTPPGALFEGVVTLDVAGRETGAEERVFAFRATGPSARIDEAIGIAQPHATSLVNWDDVEQREQFLHSWIMAARARREVSGRA